MAEYQVLGFDDPRNTDLTTMYRSKYLYEIPHIQWRSCSTPGETQCRNAYEEQFHFTLVSPSPQAGTAHHLLQEGMRMEVCSTFYQFRGLLKGLVSVHLTWSADGRWHSLHSWGWVRKRKVGDGLWSWHSLAQSGKDAKQAFSLRREGKKWKVCLVFQFFRKLPERLVCASPDLGWEWGAGILCLPGRWREETGGALLLCTENLHCCRETPEGTRDEQLLKKKLASFAIENCPHKPREAVSSPKKASGLIAVWSQSIKIGICGWSFKNVNLNIKLRDTWK